MGNWTVKGSVTDFFWDAAVFTDFFF